MQDPNEDTEWNDLLRSKGILPPKEEVTLEEDAVVQVKVCSRKLDCPQLSDHHVLVLY